MSWLDLMVAIAATAVLISAGFISGAWWAAARVRTLVNRINEQWREW